MDCCRSRRVHVSSDSLIIIRAHHTVLFPPCGALKTSPLNFFYSSSSFRFCIIYAQSSYFPGIHSSVIILSFFCHRFKNSKTKVDARIPTTLGWCRRCLLRQYPLSQSIFPPRSPGNTHIRRRHLGHASMRRNIS